MRSKSLISIALSVALMGGTSALADHHGLPTSTASMIDNAGKNIGAVTVTQGPLGSLIHVKVSGLEPGKHGLHIHKNGVCDPEDGFKSAMGHVAHSEDGIHGLLNPEGSHAGDLPNLYAGADGNAEAEFFTPRINIGSGTDEDLLDYDGSAFIIHAQSDDHVSQPIGGAGARVSCGIIAEG